MDLLSSSPQGFDDGNDTKRQLYHGSDSAVAASSVDPGRGVGALLLDQDGINGVTEKLRR